MIADRFNISQSIVAITGGAGLLGIKHAEACLSAGANVCLLDIDLNRLNLAKQSLAKSYSEDKIEIFSCDITQEDQLRRVQAEIQSRWQKSPDILINNAAIDSKFDQSNKSASPSRMEHFSIESWNLELGVGLTGAFLCTKVFGTDMARSGKGAIVNIASDLGLIAPNQELYRIEGVAEEEQPVKPITYSVIKHGLIGMTKYTATYWANKGVRCNALAPGGVFNEHNNIFVERINKLIPMGRMARQDEYQAAVLFLCSDASSYMTGSVISIDGGRTAW